MPESSVISPNTRPSCFGGEICLIIHKAYEKHEFFLTFLNVAPEYDPLRDDPRFQDLLRLM